jgi:hypothetical protein
MIPTTARTDLDHITGEFTAALGESLQLLRRSDAPTETGKSGTEDVGDEHQLVRLADRTVLTRRLCALPRGPHEFGMGIAHLMLGEATFSKLGDQVLARESVINLSRRASFDAPDRPARETHKG